MDSEATELTASALHGPPARRGPAIWAAYGLAVLAPVISAGLYYRSMMAAGVQPGFPLDDSWIHAQYARTLVEGRPLEYVPGERSIGTTSLLFDVVWAAATLLTGEYVHTIYAVNLLCTILLAACLVALLLAMQIPPLTAGVGAALIVSSHPFPYSTLSGMETALAALLTTAAVLTHVGWGRREGPRPLAAPILMALAAMTRPENLVLYPLSECDRLIRRFLRPGEPSPSKPSIRFAARALAFGMTMLPYFAVNLAVHGAPVPNTYAAKVGKLDMSQDIRTGGLGVLPERIRIACQVIYDAFYLVWSFDNAVLLAPAILGILFCFLPRREADRTIDSRRRVRYALPAAALMALMVLILIVSSSELALWQRTALVLACGMASTLFWYAPRPEHLPAGGSLLPILVFVGATGASGMATLGVFFPGQWQRYLIQWIPLILIYGVLGMHLLARSAAALLPRVPVPAYAAVIVLFVGGNLWFIHQAQFLPGGSRDHFVTSVKNINEMQVVLGKWVDANTPPDAVIATNDIGAIAFFGNRPIVDTIGLIDPEVVRRRRQPHNTQLMLDYLRQRRVTHAILFPRWHPDLLLDPRFVFVEHVALEDNVICGDESMVVAEIDWDRRRTERPNPPWLAEEINNCEYWLTQLRRMGAL